MAAQSLVSTQFVSSHVAAMVEKKFGSINRAFGTEGVVCIDQVAEKITDLEKNTDQSLHDVKATLAMVKKLLESQLIVSSPDVKIDTRMIIKNLDCSWHICNEVVKNDRCDTGEINVLQEAKSVVDSFLSSHDGNFSITFVPLDSETKAFITEVDFSRVLSNIIRNALEHTSYNTEISVSFEKTKRWVSCSVENTNSFVDRFRRKEIFKKGHTTKKDSKGSGLGLAICAEIIERWGGRITCESEKEIGELPHFFRTVLLASVCHNYFVSASRSFVSQRGMETYPVVEHLNPFKNRSPCL